MLYTTLIAVYLRSVGVMFNSTVSQDRATKVETDVGVGYITRNYILGSKGQRSNYTVESAKISLWPAQLCY